MKAKGYHTFAEIISQPAVWSDVIESYSDRRDQVASAYRALAPERVLFIGCGSTHYLSQVAAALFMGLSGIPASAAPSSELLLFPEQVIANPKRTLLVAISRSGTTTETVQAVSHFRRLGGSAVWVIGCDGQSALAQSGDLVLLAEAAQEKSVAQTRSFSSMLILAEALAATVAGEDVTALAALPHLLGRHLESAGDRLTELGGRLDLERIFFLGSGFQHGIANEAMLKMKEMSLTNSEAYHFMEFRHGPMSMVSKEALVVGLISNSARVHEGRVLSEMMALGGHVVGLNGAPGSGHDDSIVFPTHALPSWAMPVLYLPALQLLAYHRSVAKGLDPDSPRNLEAVVSLDSSAFFIG